MEIDRKILKEIIKKISRVTIDVIFWICIAAIIFVLIQVFIFCSFKIPSDSMEPELIPGDNVVVAKLIPGPRIFNIFDSLEEKQVKIRRVPGIRKIKRNDVVVFNFPHPSGWDKIEMHIMKYYIKRCIGIPGDTVRIINGNYRITGLQTPLGDQESQKRIAQRPPESFDPGVFRTFPFDSVMGWNIQDFGPLIVPSRDDSLPMNGTTYKLYKKMIEWEQKTSLTFNGTEVLLDGQPIQSYTFIKNYYFMAGDLGENSQDSRYWGLLPEEYIVGKAWLIWRSKDPRSNKFRWNRFLKAIN